jgi:EAL domain-containing protein (putative c-di-GMP-specific phosphodiesterase class I)
MFVRMGRLVDEAGLMEHGCPVAQGFHLGRPAPACEVEPLLRRAAA